MSRARHDAVFAALGDPTRRAVVEALSRGGPCTATTLAGRLPVTRQAIAKHLSMLEDAGLVTSVREGREVRYRLSPAPLADAMSWMTSVGARWDERLERLSRLLTGRRSRSNDDR